MKVLFVNPSRAGQGSIPINIPLLVAAGRCRGHEVRLFDCSDYASFDSARDSYESVFFKDSQFNESALLGERKEFFERLGLRHLEGARLRQTDYKADLEFLVSDFGPELVAVSSLSVDFAFACDLLLPLKKKYKFKVMFGGIHAILLPQEVIDTEASDIVCIGEGENSFPNVLDALAQGRSLDEVKGIRYKSGDMVVKNQPQPLTDLNTIRPPDFSLFDPLHFYRPFDGKRYKMVNYELSRGCIFNCTYCVNGVLKSLYDGLGKYHRIKTVGKSIDDLRALVSKYGFNFVRFWDEDFTTTDEDYLARFAQAYLKQIRLPFLIYARVNTVTEEKVRILKEMGCRTFAMGIESGSEFIRKKVMNRQMSNAHIVEKFSLVKKYGIRVSAYNMMGLPYETRDHIFETIELNRIVNPDSFSVTLLEPYKGTPIRTMCEAEGLDPQHATVYNKAQFVPKGMTEEELRGLFRAFPLYIRFPKSRYEEVREAERDDDAYAKLLREFASLK